MIPRYVKPLNDAAPHFQRAVPYEEFVAAYDEPRTEKFRKAYDAAVLEQADVDWFRRRAEDLGGTMRILVINENWCGDGILNLAVLGRLAAETGVMDIRVLYRDAPENQELVEEHFLTMGAKKLPVFVFMDQKGTEIGRFASRTLEQEEALLAGDIDFLRDYYFSGRYLRPLINELQRAAAGAP